MDQREEIAGWLKSLQDEICVGLEQLDGEKKFREDKWERSEGGGGRTRVIEDGKVFEKGGVNFSAVHGKTPSFLLKESAHSVGANQNFAESVFFATGLSIVIHPQNPWVPIIHMNIRYFEMRNGNEKTFWLGGGIDLTPHYYNEDDAAFFHDALKKMCGNHHHDYYPRFSKWADQYFYLPHRKETRGIGGIFFDRLNEKSDLGFEKNLGFWKDTGKLFLPVYSSLVQKHRDKKFTEKEKEWQFLRRGRYVEFNLIYDKGTKFGLETGGRVESILMSLPKHASWIYDQKPSLGSPEERTLTYLRKNLESF
jgi:coproporphyrinogen III oxidase